MKNGISMQWEDSSRGFDKMELNDDLREWKVWSERATSENPLKAWHIQWRLCSGR